MMINEIATSKISHPFSLNQNNKIPNERKMHIVLIVKPIATETAVAAAVASSVAAHTTHSYIQLKLNWKREEEDTRCYLYFTLLHISKKDLLFSIHW